MVRSDTCVGWCCYDLQNDANAADIAVRCRHAKDPKNIMLQAGQAFNDHIAWSIFLHDISMQSFCFTIHPAACPGVSYDQVDSLQVKRVCYISKLWNVIHTCSFYQDVVKLIALEHEALQCSHKVAFD